MPDAAPVAAPVAPASAPAAQAGTTIPAGTPIAPAVAAQASGTPSRGPDGKFVGTGGTGDAPAGDAQKQLVKLLNGKELSLDDVVRLATKQDAGEDKFREASEHRKAVDAESTKIKNLFEAMAKDPDGFADEFAKMARAKGADPTILATKLLEPLIKAEMDAAEEKTLTTEQLEARQLKRENEELKRQQAKREFDAKKAEEEKTTAAHQEKVTQLKNTYAETIQAAMEASKLPKTVEMALEMVATLKDLHARGLADHVTPEHLAADMRQRKLAEYLAVQEAMGEDLSWVNPKMLEAARKKAVESKTKDNVFSKAKPVSRPKQKAQGEQAPETKGKSLDAIKRDLMMGRTTGKLA